MGIIRILEEHVANLIAAGEVVERPASVVKELVENAIDAGAKSISVQVEEGGLRSIRVTDDGKGMEAEDVAAAFERHATSKVWESRDLSQIRTLGFRGEALPSIASVARVECISAPDRSGLGCRLVLEGGNVLGRENHRAAQGTDITIRDLFFNTPARLKYMKTVQTEFGHISDFIYRISLAHAEIAFHLTHNGNVVLKSQGNGDLLQTIAAIYGTTTARSMLEVNEENADFALRGWIAKPELTRSNRYGMTMIVNGRYIRSYPLQNAIIQAYHTLLPINRYPIAVLQFRMDPALLDVNVHPSKMEVRFSKEAELTMFVQDELRKLLLGADLIPRMQAASEKKGVVQEQLAFYSDTKPDVSAQPSVRETSGSPASMSGIDDPRNRQQDRQVDDSRYERGSGSGSGSGQSSSYASKANQWPAKSGPVQPASEQWKEFMQTADTLIKERRLPELHVIGQMHGTYIIAQNDEGLILIDQHAAHERINYERFYAKFGSPEQASQELLVPLTMEFTSFDAAKLKEKAPLFAQIGVYWEPFGGNTFMIRAVPEWMPKGEEQDILEELAQWALQDRALDVAKLREKSAILSACKASLKANDYLSEAEILSLLSKLRECVNPFTCPHGRPIIVSFSTYELEKMFKRVT